MSEGTDAGGSARSLFTVQEAADQLGISAHTLRDAIKRGVVDVERINPRLNMLTRDEIERYQRERLGKRGGYRGRRSKRGGETRSDH